MIRCILYMLCMAAATAACAQTDSADLFFQKGLQEKQAGRRMESLKNFEKAMKYNENSKAINTELAFAAPNIFRSFV